MPQNSAPRSFLRKILYTFLLSSAALLMTRPMLAADEYKDEQTLRDAAHVLEEMFKSNSIPPDLFKRAECVIVMPNVKKFGIGIGGTGGRGPMSCRRGENFRGKWSAPAMYTIGGASVGLQFGGTSSDFVLLVMDRKGYDAILKGKTKLGHDATAAAGPGATEHASADNDILTYARAKGLFAGVSLGGASIDFDTDANKRLYGKSLAAHDILRTDTVHATEAGHPLIEQLNLYTGVQ